MVRGAFEYQGQKCSALSRAYIPTSIWPELSESYIKKVNEIKVGDVEDFSNFMNAVIDKSAYDSIVSYIDDAKNEDDAKIIDAMSLFPKIIERPIVVSGDEAVIGRPPENAQKLI